MVGRQEGENLGVGKKEGLLKGYSNNNYQQDDYLIVWTSGRSYILDLFGSIG